MNVSKDQVLKYILLCYKVLGALPKNDRQFDRTSQIKGYVIAVIALGIVIFQCTALLGRTNIITVLE